jgi:hypothetical protein
MKIMVTVNYGSLQVCQTWDFIPQDEQNGEDAILILNSFTNGDIVGIPLVASQIKKQDGAGVAEFHYNGSVLTSDAELIPRAGKSN